MAMNRLGGQLLCRNGFGPTGFRIARNLDLDPIQDIAFRDLEMSMQKMDAEGIMGVVANKKLAQVLERDVRYPWLLLRLGKTIRATRRVSASTKITGGGGLGSSQAYTFRESAKSSALGE